MRFYFEFHFDQNEGYLAHLHDPLAAAVALDPDLVQCRPAAVDVELTGTLTRGMTIADWSNRWGREPNALIGVEVDPAVFFDRFIAQVGGSPGGWGSDPPETQYASVPVTACAPERLSKNLSTNARSPVKRS